MHGAAPRRFVEPSSTLTETWPISGRLARQQHVRRLLTAAVEAPHTHARKYNMRRAFNYKKKWTYGHMGSRASSATGRAPSAVGSGKRADGIFEGMHEVALSCTQVTAAGGAAATAGGDDDPLAVDERPPTYECCDEAAVTFGCAWDPSGRDPDFAVMADSLPDVVPYEKKTYDGWPGDAPWHSAAVIIPWEVGLEHAAFLSPPGAPCEPATVTKRLGQISPERHLERPADPGDHGHIALEPEAAVLPAVVDLCRVLKQRLIVPASEAAKAVITALVQFLWRALCARVACMTSKVRAYGVRLL